MIYRLKQHIIIILTLLIPITPISYISLLKTFNHYEINYLIKFNGSDEQLISIKNAIYDRLALRNYIRNIKNFQIDVISINNLILDEDIVKNNVKVVLRADSSQLPSAVNKNIAEPTTPRIEFRSQSRVSFADAENQSRPLAGYIADTMLMQSLLSEIRSAYAVTQIEAQQTNEEINKAVILRKVLLARPLAASVEANGVRPNRQSNVGGVTANQRGRPSSETRDVTIASVDALLLELRRTRRGQEMSLRFYRALLPQLAEVQTGANLEKTYVNILDKTFRLDNEDDAQKTRYRLMLPILALRAEGIDGTSSSPLPFTTRIIPSFPITAIIALAIVSSLLVCVMMTLAIDHVEQKLVWEKFRAAERK
ncbi:hypothetical protein [Pandoraea sputorum]|uniref:hypothetical protein n=1 Tax=Pandoraea sputorum TaxID=93222 RepID=UPI002AF6A5C1|nr:hypothetical protein [Pandoraea sputorum]